MSKPTQLELQKRIVERAGVNVVNCGSCGIVLFHLVAQTEIVCPECQSVGEPCDFPDFHY